ncbi:MAG: hypothetical protein IT287_07900, partial [Bdellovibrionaceae bacterium]|nr:hypothetical protein [Pseudobdellovibrionaceae bacterium]
FTEEAWNATLEDWNSLEPLDPGFLQLFYAWDLYNKEEAIVAKIKGDKRKHCYMGCRIAQQVSLDTAIYVAWYKEKKDLTDCKANTYFEVRDHEVTLQGAELGQVSAEPQYCMDECNAIKRFK